MNWHLYLAIKEFFLNLNIFYQFFANTLTLITFSDPYT